MAGFSARPLGILDRIYRFIGGLRGVGDVNIEGSIQLVHDVAPGAIRASSYRFERGGGVVTLNVSQAHVGATTVRSAYSLTGIIGSVDASFLRSDYDAYILSVAVTADTPGNCTNCTAAVVTDSNVVDFVSASAVIPLLYVAGANTFSVSDFAGTGDVALLDWAGARTFLSPVFVPLGKPGGASETKLTVRSISTGNLTLQVQFRILLLPAGAPFPAPIK